MNPRFLLIALAACSIPDKHPGTGDGGTGSGSDARTSDAAIGDGPANVDGSMAGAFGCRGQPFPQTAPPVIKLTGQVRDPASNLPLAGVPMNIIDDTTGGQLIPQFNSDANAAFTVQISTNAVPVKAHMTTAGPPGAGYVPVAQYPSRPYDHDLPAMSVALLTQAQLTQQAAAANTNWSPNQATLIVVVIDCNDVPQAGARVQPPNGGIVAYLANGVVSPNLQSTDQSGQAVIFNAPPPQITVDATLADGSAQRPHTVNASGNLLTEVYVQP